MRQSPGSLQHCAEIRSLIACISSKPTLGGGKMNRLVRLLIAALVSVVLGLCTPAGVAQSKSAGDKTTVTGCLQKGDEADEFSITGEDGKTYMRALCVASLKSNLLA